MSKDYYKILGVDKNASPEEIKKAFRKLAHQCHPDKPAGDEKKFKEINEAYQVLGNTDKREKYDQYGSTFEEMGGFGHGMGWDDFMKYARGNTQQGENFDFGGINLGDIFGDLFGFSNQSGSGSGWSGFGGSGRSPRNKGNDISIELTINFEEAAFGTEKILSLHKNIVCKICQGSGLEPGSKMINCSQCRGSGRVTSTRQTIFGVFQNVIICPVCQGEGRMPEKKCQSCRGAGVVRGTPEIKVKIPTGINQGEALKLTGQGEAGHKGSPAGNLYIHIDIRPHHKFERHGYDIYSTEKINFSQAALGDKIKVATLSGEVLLKIPSGTQSGRIFKLKNKGIAKLHSRCQGDHLIKVIVKTPENLTREQKNVFEELRKTEK